MVVPFKLDHFGPTGPTSCEAQCKLYDLGAGPCESHGAIWDWNRGRCHLGYLEFAFKLRGEDEAMFHLPCYGIGYELGSMSEDVRSHSLHVIDVLVAVSIPDQRAVAVGEEQRLASRLQSANLG